MATAVIHVDIMSPVIWNAEKDVPSFLFPRKKELSLRMKRYKIGTNWWAISKMLNKFQGFQVMKNTDRAKYCRLLKLRKISKCNLGFLLTSLKNNISGKWGSINTVVNMVNIIMTSMISWLWLSNGNLRYYSGSSWVVDILKIYVPFWNLFFKSKSGLNYCKCAIIKFRMSTNSCKQLWNWVKYFK